jgi:hypothetical protein
MNKKSTIMLLDLESRMKTIDYVVQTIQGNAAASGSDRATCYTDLTACVNDLRAMETEILKFEDTLGSYTPALATYTTAEKLYKGRVTIGTDTASQAAALAAAVGPLTTVIAAVLADQAKGIVSNRGASRAGVKGIDTDNTFLSKSGTYTTDEADVLTKLAAVNVLLPTLTPLL